MKKFKGVPNLQLPTGTQHEADKDKEKLDSRTLRFDAGNLIFLSRVQTSCCLTAEFSTLVKQQEDISSVIKIGLEGPPVLTNPGGGVRHRKWCCPL